jgi:diguanylate cyclase (GGDEF)-like protein
MDRGGHVVDQPMRDPVTGAYPRALLPVRLAAELAAAGPFSLFLFDVDYFKTVNDAYGHRRGDVVLAQLADRITELVRTGDELFRYGGDEFVLLLPRTGPAEALRLALRLTDGVRATVFPGEPPLALSISLGVASYPDHGNAADDLIDRADRRNYLAKRRGRGGAVADDDDDHGTAAPSRLWERDAALAATHDFLTRLRLDGRGALQVRGEPGAGHTRFLDEVAKIATMRGFAVRHIGARADDPATQPTELATGRTAAQPAAQPAEPATGRTAANPATQPAEPATLLIADLDDGAHIQGAVAAARATPGALGLAYAVAGRSGPDPILPVLAAPELAPWSPAALRIWLRATLDGEPSRSLVSWIAGNSGGLPARAARELDRLRSRGGLVATGPGGWTVAPRVLGRPRRRTALPAPMTPLVGRIAERDRVVRLLASNRLVTLVGPGGIGKTRLSLAAATAAADRFDDGAVFVPLADAADADHLMSAVAHALQVAEVPGEPLADTVADHLAEASMLLVLDNFEQILPAAPVLGALLAVAPGVTALVTSRERLSLYGEKTYLVPPLTLPDLDALPAGAAGVARALAESPAVALFDQRAQAADDSFALTAATLPTVTALCGLLDGLPLAIELAAARVDRWSPEALLAHLRDHLHALGDGPRDLPARQQTLRGAIDWSFDLLPPADRLLFAALAVFGGGFTAEAAFAVAEPGPVDGARRLFRLGERLGGLVDKSLLTVATDGAEPRYGMLETIRAYAVARLAAEPDADEIRDRHAGYFTAFAAAAADGLTGPDQASWSERIEREYGNLRAAMAWALARGAAGRAATMCLGLWRYWRSGNHIGEGRERLAALLDPALDGLPDGVRARLAHAAAVLATSQDDHDTADRFGHDSLRLADAVGDSLTMAHARNALGIAAIGAGDYDLATVHFQASLDLWRELGNGQGTAMALGNLTKVMLRLGDIEAAGRYADQCLKLERASGNTRGICLGLECLGQIRLARGDVPGARAALAESLALSRGLGDLFGEAMALHHLGLAAFAEGAPEEALRHLVAALALRHEVGDREDLAVSLDSVGHAVAATDPELAVLLVGAAGTVRERNRLPVPPEVEPRRRAALIAGRDALGEQGFAEVWAAARAMPLDLVVDRALDAGPDT